MPLIGLAPQTSIRLWGPSPSGGFLVDREVGFSGLLESPSIANDASMIAYARYWKDGTRYITTIKTYLTQSGAVGENLYTTITSRAHYQPMVSNDGRTAFRVDDPPSRRLA